MNGLGISGAIPKLLNSRYCASPADLFRLVDEVAISYFDLLSGVALPSGFPRGADEALTGIGPLAHECLLGRPEVPAHYLDEFRRLQRRNRRRDEANRESY
jgi:hypothetical protein